MWSILTPLRHGFRREMSTMGKNSKNGNDNCPAQAKRNQELKEKINQYQPPLGNFMPVQNPTPPSTTSVVARNGIAVCPVQLQRVVQTQDSILKRREEMDEKKK